MDELLERLNFALKSGRMGSFEYDFSTGLMRWDARMHELLGVDPGDFSGKYDDFLALVHFEDRPKMAERVTATLSRGTECAVKFRVFSPLGRPQRFLEMGFKVHSRTDGITGRISGVWQKWLTAKG